MNTPHEKFGFTVEEAAAAAGMGRTKVFEAIRLGKLKARKSGRRTIVLADDLRAYLASLPCRQVSDEKEAA